MMQITRTSILTGVERTMDIPVTLEQLHQYEIENKPIQKIMPNLTDDEREFIMTGITAEEWDQCMGTEEEVDFDDEPAF